MVVSGWLFFKNVKFADGRASEEHVIVTLSPDVTVVFSIVIFVLDGASEISMSIQFPSGK